jgi:two-component system CheB/CheR fusion protein
MVVEDETDSLDLLGTWFEDQGYEVLAVRSGAAALEQAERFAPDLLLTDYFLPGGVNGIEVVRRLLGWFPDLQAILMTGMLQGTFTRDLVDRKQIPVMLKPFNFRTLAATLDGLP